MQQTFGPKEAEELSENVLSCVTVNKLKQEPRMAINYCRSTKRAVDIWATRGALEVPETELKEESTSRFHSRLLIKVD